MVSTSLYNYHGVIRTGALSPVAALGVRHVGLRPTVTCVAPGTRRIGRHTIRNDTFLSFPIGGAVVCPRCHHGRTRLTGVHTAVSAVHGSGGVSVAKVHLRKCTSPRNDCTGGSHLTGNHATTLLGCMHGCCSFPRKLLAVTSAPRS